MLVHLRTKSRSTKSRNPYIYSQLCYGTPVAYNIVMESENMDRPIDPGQIKKRNVRRIILWAASLVVVLLVFHLVSNRIRPSVDRIRIRTATAETGSIEATVSARGIVVPEYEHVISSPIDTRVTKILITPGTEIEAGQPIVRLDVSASKLRLARLESQISLQQNARRRAEVELERQLTDLRSSRALQELELQSCQYRAQRDRELVELGVCSEDQARTSETETARARIELEHIDESITNARQSLTVQLQGLDLEIDILRKDRDEADRQLALASPASDQAGVLTWVIPSEGASVRKGDELARIADLSSFRVEASISDVHASRISIGQLTRIESGDNKFTGTVSNILPTVENGIVRFEVTLDDNSHSVLRHNLRVDVYVVTEHKTNIVRIKRGAYVTVEGRKAVYVIRGDVARRTPIKLGVTNFEFFEIQSGIVPGDEVIISDMSSRMHAKEVRLR